MESQTESNTVDQVSEDQFPDWLVGVIVVIAMLVMAVIILIITTFIKNRSKSRSNQFSTAADCDDLESGKLGHDLDSTVMTSLTSLPHTIDDSTLLSHSVAVSAEYDQQIPSPTGADPIYSVLGCRNPLFVDDEIGGDERNNNLAGTLATSDQLGSRAVATDGIQVPPISSGYLGHDATGQDGSQTMYIRKTSLYKTKIRQTDQTAGMYANERDTVDIKGFVTTFQHDRQTNGTGTVNNNMCSLDNDNEYDLQASAACRENELLATAGGNPLEDRDVPECVSGQVVVAGSGNCSLSVTTGSGYQLSNTDYGEVTDCRQSGHRMRSGYVPRQADGVISSKDNQLINTESPAAVDPCGVSDEGRSATSQDPQHPSLICDSNPPTENKSEMYVDTMSPEPETLHSESETLHSESETLHSESETLHSESETLHSEPETLHSEPETLHSEPETLHSEPETLYSEPETLHCSTKQADDDSPNHGLAQTATAVSTESVELISSIAEDNQTSPAANPTLVVPTSHAAMPTLVVPTSHAAMPTPDLADSQPSVWNPTQTFPAPNLTCTTTSSATEAQVRELEATVEPEVAHCQRWNVDPKQSSNGDVDDTKERLADISAASSSAAIVGADVGQVRNLDPSNIKDLVTGDDVILQTVSLSGSTSDTDHEIQQTKEMKGWADVFDVHL